MFNRYRTGYCAIGLLGALASAAHSGTITKLALDLNSLAVEFHSSVNADPRLGTTASATRSVENENPRSGNDLSFLVAGDPGKRSLLSSGFGVSATGTLLIRKDSDSVGQLLVDDVSKGSFENSAFAFSGEIRLVSGSVTGGFLRFTSLSDGTEVLLDVGADGQVRRYPNGGAFFLRSSGSQGYVNRDSLVGANSAPWFNNSPNAASFVALRFLPPTSGNVDQNVDIDIDLLATVVPLPSSLLAGVSLLLVSSVAGLRRRRLVSPTCL